MPTPDSDRPRICYLMGSLSLGGAQTGLMHQLANGLGQQAQVTLISPVPHHPQIDLTTLFTPHARVIHCGSPRHVFSYVRLFMAALMEARHSDALITCLFPATILGRLVRLLVRRPPLVTVEVVSIYHRDGSVIPDYPPSFCRLLRATSRLTDIVMWDSLETARGVAPLYPHHRGESGVLQTIGIPSAAHPCPPPIPGGRVRLVSVGRLTSQKDFSSAIRGLSLLLARGVDADLTLLGEGPERAALHALAIREQIDGRVHFAGVLPPSEVPAFLSGNGFHIYLQTSRYEGLCLTLVEGMAQGLAVITTAAGGIADYAEDGVNCLICPMESPEALAERVERLALDPLLHQRLAAGALQTVRDRFSPESQARSVAALLERINRAKEHGT